MDEPMAPIVAPEKCTGCGVCRNLCPHDAIRMDTDDEGFFSPVIDQALCRRCGLCRRKCPQTNPPILFRNREPDVYACWNLDPEKRAVASSGGMFSVYGEQVLEKGGTVFGVAYDQALDVRFVAARTKEELKPLSGSKYVQADPQWVYREANAELEAGREVLFVGTPCQVAGLYAFLGEDRPNLLTCDFLCHGVPSPLFYRKWLDDLAKRYRGPIVSINMRSKLCRSSFMGIEIRTDSRPPIHKFLSWRDRHVEYLGKAFLKNYALRKSCYDCPYIKYPRMGDITLADFWKLGNLGTEESEKPKGISLNLINSKKGARVLEEVADRVRLIRRDLAEAVAGNSTLYRHTFRPSQRDAFVRDTVRYDYKALIRKYRKELYDPLVTRILGTVKRRLRFLLKGN